MRVYRDIQQRPYKHEVQEGPEDGIRMTPLPAPRALGVWIHPIQKPGLPLPPSALACTAPTTWNVLLALPSPVTWPIPCQRSLLTRTSLFFLLCHSNLGSPLPYTVPSTQCCISSFLQLPLPSASPTLWVLLVQGLYLSCP